jgi:hypothetical protein
MADIKTTIEESIKNGFKQYIDALSGNISGGEIFKIMVELDEKAHEVAKTFGQGAENIYAIKAAIADATTSVQRLGGDLKDVVDIQTSVSKELGRNIILNSDSYDKLYAAAKVSSQSAQEIVGSFKDAGISAYNASKQMQTVIDSARQMGVNAASVSKMVLENTKLMNQYNFVGGVEGLSKMAAQAVSLRIEMKDIQTFASTVFKPEGAIEMAAALQRLGVAQSDLLDPLRLMDLSSNDPTELQNQIVKMSQQFTQLKKDGSGFEIAPGAKRQMMEIEEAMKLTSGTLAKMALGSAELDMKMKKISFPSSMASDDDKKMIANLAEMNKEGKFEISFNNEKGELVTKTVSELSKDDVEILKKSSETKPLEKIAEEQLSLTEDMAASLRAVKQQLPYAIARSAPGQKLYTVQRDVMNAFEKTFINESTKTKTLAEGINKHLGTAVESLSDALAGKKSPIDALNSLKTSFESATNYFKKLTGDTMKAGKAAGREMMMSENDFTQMFITVLKKLADTQAAGPAPIKGNDVMLKGQTLVLNPEDTFFGGTGAERIYEAVEKMTSNNNIGMVNNTTQSMNSTLDINFNLELHSNQTIDMVQLERAFNSTSLKEKIVEVATLGMQRFSPEASVRKKMNREV